MADSANFTNLSAALAVATVAAAVNKASDLRAKAQECEERAGRTADSWSRQQFQDCANEWRRLAAQAEERVY